MGLKRLYGIDTGIDLPASLAPIQFQGAILLQKKTQPKDAFIRSIPETPRQRPEPAPVETAGKARISLLAKRQDRIPPEPDPAAGRAGRMLDQARRLADQGSLADALAVCDQAMNDAKLNPILHYLQATILQEMGRTGDAVAALHRALYIDQEFVIAHFALGSLQYHLGKRKEGAKHLSKALALLKASAHEEILPEAEGMSAGRLIEMITMMQGIEGRR